MRNVLAAVAVSIAFWALPARAYDPNIDWQTLVTPNFRLHYFKGMYPQALAAARDAETAFAELTKRLAWRPMTPIDIVLDDETDGANGSSRAYPYNLISLNAVAPDETSVLSDYDDWLYVLLAHELTHDVHIDTIENLPRAINGVLGRVLVPNSIQPSWYTEGLAVYFETEMTSRGRLRAPYYDMLLRMQVLEGREFTIDEATANPIRWPQGTGAYLYGAFFMDWIRAHHGEEALVRIGKEYGSEVLPFGMNVTSTRVTRREYPEMYRDFMQDMRTRYSEQKDAVLAAGRIEGEKITALGQDTGSPRVRHDGSVVYVRNTIGQPPELRILTAGGRDSFVKRLNSTGDLALLPDDEHVLITQFDITDTFYVFGDLFEIDLRDGSQRRLTQGARAHGMDVDRAGKRAVFASNDAGHSVVRMVNLDDTEHAVVLADLGPATNVWNPRFSPDGRTVVFSGFSEGARDLFTVDIGRKVVTRITNDRALDGAPIYSPDGQWIYFHSDRTGIFDLYALEVTTREVRRITRVLGGAFDAVPAPDGGSLVYRTYGPEGFDLARVPLGASDTWPVAEADSVLRPLPKPHERLDVYPSKPYNPWPSIRPRAWLPILTQDPRGDAIGVEVEGEDALGRHAFDLQYAYGTNSTFNSFFFTYRNQAFRPGFFLSLSRNLGFVAIPVQNVNGNNIYIDEVQYYGTLSSSYPIFRRLTDVISISGAYNVRYRRPFSSDLNRLVPENRPEYGFFNSVSASVSYSNTRSYIGSISAQDGISVSVGGRLERPWLGSQFSSQLVTVDFNGYLTNPFFARHVLNIGISGGYGTSNYDNRRLFSIAGLPSRNLILDALAGRFTSAQALRGFPLTPFSGNLLINGHVEYRFPVVDIQRGIDTLPIFFRTLHLAPFLDGAAIGDTFSDLDNGQHYSVGAEARLGLTLGYNLVTTLRLGYGHGLGRDARIDNYFILLGSSF